MTLLAGLLAALVTGLTVVPAAAVANPAPRGPAPVVLVGVAGLRWDDLSPTATPSLWRLAADGSSAALVVRTVRPRTCPGDAWLTVNAGVRATGLGVDDGNRRGCPELPRPTPAAGGGEEGVTVPGFAAFAAANEEFGYAPPFGALAAGLAGLGAAPLAVGPGAALALADRDGRVGAYLPEVAALDRSVRRDLPAAPLTPRRGSRGQ